MTALRSLFTPLHGTALVMAIIGAILFFVLVFAGLHALPSRAKRSLTIAATFLAGLFYFLEFILPNNFGNTKGVGKDNFLSPAVSPLSDFLMVVGAMAFGLGLLNLIQIHGRALIRMRPGWHNAFIFFVGLIAMTAVGITHGNHPTAKGWTNAYDFLFSGLYQSLASSVFALLAFFIASAAFRAFRIGSVEATLMMVTAFIVMLGNVGSEVLTGWIPPDSAFAFLRLDTMTYWIMTTVNMSAQRALLFGIAMGELAIALRIWLSLERGHFFDQD